jgi:hypothetical protein
MCSKIYSEKYGSGPVMCNFGQGMTNRFDILGFIGSAFLRKDRIFFVNYFCVVHLCQQQHGGF